VPAPELLRHGVPVPEGQELARRHADHPDDLPHPGRETDGRLPQTLDPVDLQARRPAPDLVEHRLLVREVVDLQVRDQVAASQVRQGSLGLLAYPENPRPDPCQPLGEKRHLVRKAR